MDAAELSSRWVSLQWRFVNTVCLASRTSRHLPEEARNMGRPAKLWQLTQAANRLFPDGYAELTLSFIQSVVEAFGEAGLERLLEIRPVSRLKPMVQMKVRSRLSSDSKCG